MKHIVLVILTIFCSMFAVKFALAGVWSVAAFEGADTGTAVAPSGTTQRSLIDDFTRNERYEARFRAEVEHFWGEGYAPSDDNGLHRIGSSRCYIQATAPTVLSDSHSLIPGAGASLADYDNSTTTSASGVTDFNDAATNSAAAAEDDVGHGRCWFNTSPSDFGRLYIYQGVAGDNTPSTISDGWVPVVGTGPNLVVSNGFDATDGTGDVSSTSDPIGWDIGTNNITQAYTAATTTENTGFTYTQTASGASASTAQSMRNAKVSTSYRFSARVKSSGAADCTLSLEDPLASVVGSVANTLTATWETISMIATTDAAPTFLTLVLRVTGVADTCEWANVTAYELSGTPIQSTYSPIHYSNLDSSGSTACTGGACTNINVITVTPPGPGWVGLVTGWARVTVARSGAAATCTLAGGDGIGNLVTITPSSGTVTLETSIPITKSFVSNTGATSVGISINDNSFCTYEASYVSVILFPPGQ